MSEQLALHEQGAAALTRSRDEAWLIARARVQDPNAKNTQRAYKQAYDRWCAYCDEHGMGWGPIEPAELVTYLEGLSRKGLAPNTVRLQLSALCELDKAYRVTPAQPNPPRLRDHPVIQRWYRSWSREHPTAPRRRAAALNASALELILTAAAEPKRNAARGAHLQQYVRDRCLILFGVCGALRGNDLTQVDLSDVEPTERGLRVRVRRGKTDQEGEGRWVGILPQGKLQLCPVDAFHTWRKLRGDAPGALFIGTRNTGALDFSAPLSERSISRLLSDYAKRAGLELGVSAHSMRRTFATLAAAQKKSIEKIMRHGGWASADVALGYIEQANLFDDNASGGLLD